MDTYSVTVIVEGKKKGTYEHHAVTATNSNVWGVMYEALWQAQNDGFKPLGIAEAVRVADGYALFSVQEALWDEFK